MMPHLAVGTTGFRTFLNVPHVSDLARIEADIAILGIPYGAPYVMSGVAGHSAEAPAAIRAASFQFCDGFDHYDFDLGGPLLDGRDIRIVDCGDVPGEPLDIPATCRRATEAVRAILDRGALPIILGGDHSASCQSFKAYEGRGPITVVQIDAHADWRHEVNGVTEGYSSPMRRASELPWVKHIVQVGLRGTGSARGEEVRDALAWGARLITARQVHQQGIGAVLEAIPNGGNYLITVDCDGVDPTVMPGVAGPVPGGLTFPQVAELMQGVARKGRVVGLEIVELVPDLDVNQITAITAGRIILNVIGAAVRAGQFGR